MARWDWRRDPDKVEKVGKIRKRAKKTPRAADLHENFEKPESEWQADESKAAFGARVVEVHKRYAFVSTENKRGKINTNDVWLATIARKFLVAERAERNFVAVGDRVFCSPAPEQKRDEEPDLPRCVIQNVAPRSAKISRLDPHHPGLEHVMASNMDLLVVVASFRNPTVKWGLIDRYLVLAESEGIEAVIVLNKRDLLEDQGEREGFVAQVNEMTKIYRMLGYLVFDLQANDEHANKDPQIKQLKKILKGKISLFSGHSGVGKSSIVNLFEQEIIQPVEEDANIFYKGRHTTTYASLIKLGTGGYIIDTPGIRSFTFHEKSAIELSHCFVEMRPLLGRCKYRECRHMEEPGCVVREAVELGTISRARYKSYLGILLGATGREGRIRDLPLEDE